MKNFPNTRSEIEVNNVVEDVSNVLHVEWNNNRYILNPDLSVQDTIPSGAATEDIKQEAEQIKNKFGIENVVKMNRDNLSSYIIAGTKYRVTPKFVNQRARSDTSWRNDTTWLWYDSHAQYEYWTSCLRSNNNGVLPYNTGNIIYSWSRAAPVNKIQIDFMRDWAFPTDWAIYVDLEGDQTWTLVSADATVPSNGKFTLYRETVAQPTLAGVWDTDVNRWTTELDNHIDCYGIKVVITGLDIPFGRPAIVELSTRFEADLTDLLVDWTVSEELSDRDFVAPIGVSSANTGSLTLSNDLGTFNEQDSDNLFYHMLDEEVEFRGYLKINQDTIPMFTMLSDSWDVSGFDNATVNLVDYARKLQNLESKDMILPNMTVGAALHSLFASLGIKQFNLNETEVKQTPTLEKFYTKKEDKVWELIGNICKAVQMSASFDCRGVLQVFTKEAAFNPDSGLDYEFTADSELDKASDIISLDREDNTRFNKVTVRYNALNDFSPSGGTTQRQWVPPNPWVIGAAQIVKNVSTGDDGFWIDPNRPDDLPNWSGTVDIEGINNNFEYEGRQYYCKHAPDGDKYFRADSMEGYQAAIERNNGEAPRFTGKIFLKDDNVFNRSFYAKNFNFRQEWDTIEYRLGSKDGTRMVTGAKHSPESGSLLIDISYDGAKRFNVSKKAKNWNRFDRVGMKFKVKDRDGKAGIVLWPNGPSGYYFTVDPMTKAEITKIVKSGGENDDSSGAPPPKINGYLVRENGERKDLDVDAAKDFKDHAPVRIDHWAYLEVAVFPISGGYEFEVFVDGEYCKTYTDKSVRLNRNEKAGMTFLGNSKFSVDKFYVINYPADAIEKGKNKKDDGWVARRKDLWKNRKHSNGEKAYSNYLKMMNRHKKTQVFEFDFSGRFHSLARERQEQTVRFEFPALTAEMVMTNKAVDVIDFKPSGFGARFVIANTSERPQLMKGEAKNPKNSSGPPRTESSYIFGTSFRVADQQEIEYKKDALIDRIGTLPLEFESDWIQNRETANALAKWVMDRFGENAETYRVEVFGNPLLEIGDTVTMTWLDKGLQGYEKWCVVGVRNTWSSGLETEVTVRKIT